MCIIWFSQLYEPDRAAIGKYRSSKKGQRIWRLILKLTLGEFTSSILAFISSLIKKKKFLLARLLQIVLFTLNTTLGPVETVQRVELLTCMLRGLNDTI